jgi:Gluconate 2-dehydrogenase subunit 3
MKTFPTPFPDYDVMAKRESPSWNEQTREVIDRRLHEVPPRRFLSEDEWSLLAAIVDRILPQPERDEPVPIAPWIDDKLCRNRGPGYRWADMPPLREAWRQGLKAVAGESVNRHGLTFQQLTNEQKDALLGDVQHGRVDRRFWGDLPPDRFFVQLLLKEIVSIYYAHPLAWNEIGYGGPASPRGYVRLGLDERDPWEAEEVRPVD